MLVLLLIGCLSLNILPQITVKDDAYKQQTWLWTCHARVSFARNDQINVQAPAVGSP